MEILKSLLQNEYVVTLLCAAALYLGNKVINYLVNKWPVLRKLKLQEKWERVIDKVKEDKIAAKSMGSPLTYNEIQMRVKDYASEARVNPDDVKLHRRALKRNSLGLSVGIQGKTPTASLNFSRDF